MSSINLGKCLFHAEGNHDKTKKYDKLAVVMNTNGDTYTAKKNVPIGIELSNTEYWTKTASVNAQINKVQSDINTLGTQISNDSKRLNKTIDIGTVNANSITSITVSDSIFSSKYALSANPNTNNFPTNVLLSYIMSDGILKIVVYNPTSSAITIGSHGFNFVLHKTIN